MTLCEVVVPTEADGRRVDVFLAECKELECIPSRSAAQNLLSQNFISLCGKVEKILQKNYKVTAGDVLICQIPAPVPYSAEAEDIPICVVYEDEHLLVVDKPQGMVVHPAAGHFSGTLVNALMHHCRGRLSGVGGVLRPGIVHRLDKDTSGLIVVAKNDAAHHALSEQLSMRTMGRTYNAICHGVFKQDEMRIDLPIGRHPSDRKKMAAITKITSGTNVRNAVTYVKVLERFAKFTLVSARLETGRTHQIRVHLSHMGKPILGDATYGGETKSFCQTGQLLHAKEIRLVHPATKETMVFESPLPEHFCNALNVVGARGQ